MNLWVMRPDEVPRNWGWMQSLLRRKVTYGSDDVRPYEQVKRELVDGSLGAITVHADRAALLLLIECRRIEGQPPAMWVFWVGGRVEGRGAKALAQFAAEIIAALEPHARKAGCDEIKIQGRDWSFLPDFERVGPANRISKVL